MPLLPTSPGTRPRLALEVRPEGVVAARAEEGSSLLAAVARVELGPEAVVPQIRAAAHAGTHPPTAEAAYIPLSSAERAVLVAAVRSALESVAGRGRDTTLILPDAAVRVLLLDFDALPTKLAEALPVVRFRLKKLVPFDVDTAAVSYQVLSSDRTGVRVLAVAIPGDLLAEYESFVREAGFEPGAVLPSTLAALPVLPSDDGPALLVNAGQHWVTTAIVRGDVLLLHRSIELGAATRSPIPGAPDATEAIEPAVRVQSRQAGREFAAVDPVRERDWELAQAVSVAAAYYEDTVAAPPRTLLAAGTLSAAAVSSLLDEAGVGPIAVSELISRSAAGGDSPGGSRVPVGWLAGVRGALAS